MPIADIASQDFGRILRACLLDDTPYLLSRYFGLKRLSTLYAFTWTTYAIGGATGPLVVGKLFDRLGSYSPAMIQLLALPAFIPCLLMFLLPRGDQDVESQTRLLGSAAEIPAEIM